MEKSTNSNETRALIELVAEGIRQKEWQKNVTICDDEENEDIEIEQGTKIIVETKDNYEIIVDIKEEFIEINKMEGEFEVVTVTFNANFNENEGMGTEPGEISKRKGRSIRLPGAGDLRKEDYKFVGWSENAKESPDDVTLKTGDKFKVTSNTTLYAIWAYDTKEIRFESNGGTGIMETINVVTGKKTNLPINGFVKDGYTFKEWNIKADGSGARYGNEGAIQITENIILYAIWEEKFVLGSISPTTLDARLGTTYQITAVSTRGTTIPGNKVNWTTSDSNVISIQNGVITPKAYGKADVTAYLSDNPSVTKICSVSVFPSATSFNIIEYQKLKGTPPPKEHVTWRRVLGTKRRPWMGRFVA